MPGWDALRSTQPFPPKSRFHMMSLAGQKDGGRPGALDPAYSIHGLQVFQGFPRASVGHGKKLTGCSKADHGLCSMCQLWCRGAAGQLGSWAAGWAMSGDWGWCLSMTRRNSKVGTSWQVLDPTCMERPCAAMPRACFPLMAIRSTLVHRLSTRSYRRRCWRTRSVINQRSCSGRSLALPARPFCLSRAGRHRHCRYFSTCCLYSTGTGARRLRRQRRRELTTVVRHCWAVVTTRRKPTLHE